jgi:hypothetical protein
MLYGAQGAVCSKIHVKKHEYIVQAEIRLFGSSNLMLRKATIGLEKLIFFNSLKARSQTQNRIIYI